MNNFCTVVLTSTRQHHGLTDIDKVSISDTLSKSDIIKNCYKLCHIKIIPGEEQIAANKIKWFQDNGFEVIATIKNWKNDDVSHGSGLIEDMAKVYNYWPVLKKEYILHLENDWIWEVDDIDGYINKSVLILEEYPELIYHRYSRVDRPNMVTDLDAKMQLDDLYILKKEFSFNPFISRVSDMKYISNFVYKNNIHPHCEMAYEMAAKYLNNREYIFSFTNNGIIRHRGDQLDREWYNEKLKELK